MAATGPTGPAAPNRLPASVATQLADRATSTSSSTTFGTLASAATLDFSQAQNAKVLLSQAQTNTAGQTVYRLTLSLPAELTTTRSPQTQQQQQQIAPPHTQANNSGKQITVFSKNNYAVGQILTLQTNAQGQLQIQGALALKQQLLTQQLQTLNRLQAPPLSIAELGTSLSQLVQQLHPFLQSQLPAQASSQTPNTQHMQVVKAQVKVLQQLIQILGQLKAMQIPLDKLNGATLREHISNSGLFLENRLTQPNTSLNQGLNVLAQTDLKAILLKLSQQLNTLNQTDILNERSTGKPGSPAASGASVHQGGSGQTHTTGTHTGHSNPTLLSQLTANTQLTTLLRAVTHPEAGAQTQQAYTQAIAIAALLTFWGKLSQPSTPTKPSTGSPDGWSTLFALLFAGPKRIPRGGSSAPNTKSRGQSANTQGLSTLLNSFRNANQTHLNMLQTKQLWLANQQERPGEFKTLLTLDLPIQLPTDIHQTPLRIAAKNEHSSPKHPQGEKVWKIQLGFDLEDLGLIRTIGLFSTGRLDLTVETQTTAAKNMIEKNIEQLARPLARWGITISNLNFAPFSDDDIDNSIPEGIFQKIVDIEL